MESNLPGETSAWMGPLLDLRMGRGSSDPVVCWVLASYFFLSAAACPLYISSYSPSIPCREFSPYKQAAGNVNLAWHFPAHLLLFLPAPAVPRRYLLSSPVPPSPTLLFSSLPKAATSCSLPLSALVLFHLAGPISPDAFAAHLIVPCLAPTPAIFSLILG